MDGGFGNEFLANLVNSDAFHEAMIKKYGTTWFDKADTISTATGLLWYDLQPLIEMMYPYRELIPRIWQLPRVPGDGGSATHWKRIVAINVNNVSFGVSEGNRGARIAIAEQDMTATYKTLGLESSETFEARLGGKNLTPETLGIAIQANLRSVMIQEEQTLINGDASTPLGITPNPSLTAGAVSGLTGTFSSGTVYVVCVALNGAGIRSYTPYNSATNVGGVQGQVTKINADQSTDTYGGGSAQPSGEVSVGTSGTQCVTAQVAAVAGAQGYAWFVGSAAGAERLALLTPSNQAIFTQYPASTAQPIGNLKVGANYQDNSLNLLLPDGILSQIWGAVLGPAPGTTMATNPSLPAVQTAGDTIALSIGGSIIYTKGAGNTGLTISGANIAELDIILQAGYDQYKIGFNRILGSSQDIGNVFGALLGQASAATPFRILFDADQETGRIIAGRRVTSYMNKWLGNTLDVEVHPYMPPGSLLLWSDRVPYELPGAANILEAKTRQDYYQIQWPWRSRRYEFGCYVDEVFICRFTPAFALITNINPTSGTLHS